MPTLIAAKHSNITKPIVIKGLHSSCADKMIAEAHQEYLAGKTKKFTNAKSLIKYLHS